MPSPTGHLSPSRDVGTPAGQAEPAAPFPANHTEAEKRIATPMPEPAATRLTFNAKPETTVAAGPCGDTYSAEEGVLAGEEGLPCPGFSALLVPAAGSNFATATAKVRTVVMRVMATGCDAFFLHSCLEPFSHLGAMTRTGAKTPMGAR